MINMTEDMQQRWELALDRISQIANEDILDEKFARYFAFISDFICDFLSDKLNKINDMTLDELAEWNHALYEDIIPENYDHSYGNPSYACDMLGDGYGQCLSFLYYQIRGIIPFGFEVGHDKRRIVDIVILLELFLEVYTCFVTAAQEGEEPEIDTIKEILYWFVSDYSDVTVAERIRDQVDPKYDFATDIIMNSNLDDLSYLYKFGEYITENEIETAKHLAEMSQDAIQKMADTYTEGYRIGFVNTGKDLSIKSTVDIRYCLGFERVVRASIRNFEKMGLKPVIYRKAVHISNGSSVSEIGYRGAIPNRQYAYDHKEDNALFLNKAYRDRKLDLLKQSYEQVKELARGYAGPAVMEVFGEEPFSPKDCPKALRLDDKQKKLSVEYASSASQIVNEYIKGEERSFTIIAYPIPEIGCDYSDIFNDTVKLNTLDYETYKKIQQNIIDVLDPGIAVSIKGYKGNRTDLTVALRKLENPQKETQFENCVADVNIPVGEVFTSPVLEGTNGILHVSEVYLNGLKFVDLEIEFKDGCIQNYSCANFEDAGKCKKYIEDNILFNHKTLPLGEFAIGTNTTAYAMAKQYRIFDRMPILIAEKTGPHFAVGDTCYSHAEDVAVFNPDGKEIVSKDNSCSLKRKTEPEKAYFSCHTDITIPYDELESISVNYPDGKSAYVIKAGKFVIDGTLELNEPLM